MRRHHAGRPASAVLVGIALVFLAGCGSGSTSDSSAPSSTGVPTATASARPGCADVTALTSSLDALTKVRPLQDGLTALTAAIADSKTKLDAAAASAGTDLQPAVDQARTAFAALRTAVTGVTTGNLQQRLPAISAALRQRGTSITALATTLTQKCPAG